jgi:subtilisin family serine protease
MKKWLLAMFLAGLLPAASLADELIVKLKKDTISGLALSQSVEKIGPNTFLVEGDKKVLEANPDIEYVEPNTQLHILGWEVQSLGGLDLNEKAWGVSKIEAPKLWAEGIEGDKEIVVAVIDTGVDYEHPELLGKIWSNPKEIPDNDKDDDSNGFIDDVRGWDFVNKDNSPMDDNDHGTHCSGTIAGKDVGVVHNVKIMPLKFLSGTGNGTLSDAIKAINYAAANGAHVMSNSWGGGGFSQAMYDAIEAATKKGIVFVAAAGNSYGDNDKKPSYPASYELPGVISVAATDKEDSLAWFSNYGVQSVHVAAPGVAIYSAAKDGKYKTFNGTSMATPHVAGAAVLLLQGGFDPMKIDSVLMGTSDAADLSVRANGRVNVFRAFHNMRKVNIE